MKTITSAISKNFVDLCDGHETTVYDCALVELPRVVSPAGSITVMESAGNCPFDVRRAFYLYDVPGGSSRAGHAHRYLHQLIIAASGSFDVTIDDGLNRRTIALNRPYYGLHIVPGIWGLLHNFSSGSICLCLASERYDESDYIREYADFAQWKS